VAQRIVQKEIQTLAIAQGQKFILGYLKLSPHFDAS
jgi:hypothetical protein